MSHKRKTNKRKRFVKPRLLILCEGETERNYFKAMREDDDFKAKMAATNVTILTAKNPTPEQIVKEAIKKEAAAEKDKNPYQAVWLVFDHDNHAHRKSAYDDALKKNFKVAFSAMCFEMWLLLHFEKTGKAYSSADALIEVLKQHYPSYQKAKQNDFLSLKAHLPEAKKNALWLRKQKDEAVTHITDHNPWTEVDVLIGSL